MFDRQGQFDPREAVAESPAIPADVAPAPKGEPPAILDTGRLPEVLWTGLLYGYSGYSKMNREIALRLANSLRVCITPVVKHPDYDPYQRARFELHGRVAVGQGAPVVRCCGPRAEAAERTRYQILYTMMESEVIHPDMVTLINDGYDECWTPTPWNARVFQQSGVTVPLRVMPLGVNPLIYTPGPKRTMPEAQLLTTSRAGASDVPAGFLFIYVFLPSFRKGLDVLLPAFEEAFADDPEVGLVLATTYGRVRDPHLDSLSPHMRSRVYSLRGFYSEHEMARIYRSCDAYVCTSRGEGWNLPMCEAAACGLPVIAPNSSCHPDVVGEDALLFDHEGWEAMPDANRVSPWYTGMPWPKFGPASHRQLVAHLRAVRHLEPDVCDKAAAFTRRVRSAWTWDHSAKMVAERLVELQP